MSFLRYGFFTLLISISFFGCGSISFGPQVTAEKQIQVSSFPIKLYSDSPSTTNVGRLKFLGGLHLTSTDRRFGGFSGIITATGGKDFHAISDHGWFLFSSISYDISGSPTSLINPILGRLKDMDGGPLPFAKAVSDCEGIAPFPGVYAVSFEQEHRILIYPADKGLSGVPGSIPFPPFLYGAPANQGAEALCSFPGDRLLIFLEADPPDNWGACALGNGTEWHRFHYLRTKGFRPTAASYSESGYVYLLERYYTPSAGVKIRVLRIKADSIIPKAKIKPELIALLEPPMTIDNMEGLTVFNKNGIDHLLMISDDNYSKAQKTLLMLFMVSGD